MKRYRVCQLRQLDPIECPCGSTRRAFMTADNDVTSIHMLDVVGPARTHYHKKLTEVYVILEGTGHVELDGESVPIGPFTAILIQPGCRHRAVGKMKVLNIVVPKFDPEDEWFDEGPDPEAQEQAP